MDSQYYKYLIAIEKYGNISKAAEELYISQPALSKFLINLENEIGIQLFEKVNKKLSATYAGKKYLDTGRKILMLENCLRDEICQIKNQEKGIISITTTPNRGNYILPQLLGEFRKKFPKYQVNIFDNSMEDVDRALMQGIAKIGLYSTTKKNKQFDYILLCKEELIIALPANTKYEKYAQKKQGFRYPWLDLNLLKDEVFFIMDPMVREAGRLTKLLFEQYDFEPKVTILKNAETCLSLAACGEGAGFCFEISKKYFKNYGLSPKFFSVGEQVLEADFVIAKLKDTILDEGYEEFINIAVKLFQKNEDNKKDSTRESLN